MPSLDKLSRNAWPTSRSFRYRSAQSKCRYPTFSAARVALADEGIDYLERAMVRRPRYPEAMTYLGLLWRQKSFALLDDPIAWQAAVDQADRWQQKALDIKTGDPQRAPAPPRDGLRQAEPGSIHAPRPGKS